jgi:hypothetical protein
MRIGAQIAALVAAFVFIATPLAAVASGSPIPVAVRAPISIHAPATVVAGAELCFDVVSLGGLASVLVECNDVKLAAVAHPTSDPNSTNFCVRIPAGASGSQVTITAVSATGSVATVTVTVQ